MVFWETAHELPDEPPEMAEFARTWQAADKIVYSRTLETVSSERTRLVREFDPDAVRALKAGDGDLSVDGPGLAAAALAAGLVDEIGPVVVPVVVGGGTPFLPAGLRLDLELAGERRFDSGGVHLRYRVRP
jgi:dihydrofolate reductase